MQILHKCVSQKLAAVGPQGCRAGVPYPGVRHYGDSVHSPRVAGAVVQSGGTWYTIMLVLNGTNKCFITYEGDVVNL